MKAFTNLWDLSCISRKSLRREFFKTDLRAFTPARIFNNAVVSIFSPCFSLKSAFNLFDVPDSVWFNQA